MRTIFFTAVAFVVLCSCSGDSETAISNQVEQPQDNAQAASQSPEVMPTTEPSATPELQEPSVEKEEPSELDDSEGSVGCTSSGHGELRKEEMLESHELWLGTFTGSSIEEGYKLLSGGSVPDGLLFKGVVHIWWVSATDHTIHHGILSEGILEDLGPISVDGQIFSGMVDPDVIELDDGLLGLTVLDGFDRSGPPGPICHLRSVDGQHFETYNTILDKEERFDPSIVIAQDYWWLAVGIPSEEDSLTEIYRGINGQDFIFHSQVEGAVPDISYFDEEFQLLTCSISGMRSYSSSNGKDWSLDQVTPFRGCDPSRVTGTDLFLYKIEQGGGKEMAPPLPGEPAKPIN